MLLAAGSGRRFGTPKALVDTGSGPWVLTTLAVMSGCDELVVVLGAQAEQVEAVLPAGPDAPTVRTNRNHLSGMGSSLAIGLSEVAEGDAVAAVIMLVDLPDVTAAVLDRVVTMAAGSVAPAGSTSAAGSAGSVGSAGSAGLTKALARAAYAGRPGHPVLIGREHFAGVVAGAAGDAGARDYLAGHEVLLVECGDIGGGRDVDTPEQV